jgi:hypothetical protein
LGEHEAPKLSPGEGSLLVEDHTVEILFESELSGLENVEVQAVPSLQIGPLQLEVLRRPFAGVMIPPVGQQDTADIQK